MKIFRCRTALRFYCIHYNISNLSTAFWLVCFVCFATFCLCSMLTVNNHKFHSFPCTLFTIQLQHRLHRNKWTIYISRFVYYELYCIVYMNLYHLRLNVVKTTFSISVCFRCFCLVMFVCVSVFGHFNHWKHDAKNRIDPCKCVDGNVTLTIIGQMPSWILYCERSNWKTITMNKMTMWK